VSPELEGKVVEAASFAAKSLKSEIASGIVFNTEGAEAIKNLTIIYANRVADMIRGEISHRFKQEVKLQARMAINEVIDKFLENY
jgi:hypothetical protein